jgi:DNA-binding GntR family transcriptional regulator
MLLRLPILHAGAGAGKAKRANALHGAGYDKPWKRGGWRTMQADQTSASNPEHAPRLYRTIPEQIADSIGAAILNGELQEGARVLEEDLAVRYGVSRGSVREAIGLLERRGLLRAVPRKGTYVAGQSLDAIAELFNMRAVLIALAGRYVARRHASEAIDALRERIAALDALAQQDDATPFAMAREAAHIGDVIMRHCGAESLRRMLSEQAAGSDWRLIWQRRALDFQTPARRRAYAADCRRVLELIEAGEDDAVERLLRKILFESRAIVLRAMVAQRGGAIDPAHDIGDRQAASGRRRSPQREQGA